MAPLGGVKSSLPSSLACIAFRPFFRMQANVSYLGFSLYPREFTSSMNFWISSTTQHNTTVIYNQVRINQ